MSFISILFLAIALAMDAFAVSITAGIVTAQVTSGYALKIAFCFAGFQMIMPLTGWWLGQALAEYMVRYDHWIAFLLLSGIGGKMIYESYQMKQNCEPINFNKISVLLLLGLATSIDAFITGVGLAMIDGNIVVIIAVIGLITFVLSLLGVKIGKRLGCLVEKKAEVLGGVILILLGLKILAEHLSLI